MGSIKKQIEIKGKLLSKVKIDAAKGKLDYEVVKVLRAEINDLLDKENQMWQQWSRALFLKSGDRNTSNFHSKASHQFQRNKIAGLRNSFDLWCTEDNLIRDVACEYYHSMFTSSQPTKFSATLEALKPIVTKDMNAQLLKPFLSEQVEEAINQIDLLLPRALMVCHPCSISPFGL